MGKGVAERWRPWQTSWQPAGKIHGKHHGKHPGKTMAFIFIFIFYYIFKERIDFKKKPNAFFLKSLRDG